MTHPILRAGPFAVWRVEADALHRALYRSIDQPALVNKLYRSCAPDLPPLNLGQPPDRIWLDALEALSRAGLLEVLGERLAQQPLPAVAAAMAAVVAAQPLVRQVIIADQVIVLDRQRLRDRLDLLAAQERAEAVLLVRGEPKSGKTRCRYLFEQAARDQGATAVYFAAGMVATVEDVLRKLFGKYQARDRIPPRDATTTDAWYRSVCYELHDLAVERDSALWIAVDDLGPGPGGGALLDPEIRGFFEQFALQLMDSSVRRWFRLLLIHYPDGPVPTGWQRELWTDERTAASDVGEADVVALVRHWLDRDRSGGREPARMTDEHLAEIAAQVIAAGVAAGGGQGSRLQLIHDALVSKLDELERAGS